MRHECLNSWVFGEMTGVNGGLTVCCLDYVYQGVLHTKWQSHAVHLHVDLQHSNAGHFFFFLLLWKKAVGLRMHFKQFLEFNK